jgi:hypothetical protein
MTDLKLATQAFENAIRSVGLSNFKRTSMFLGSQQKQGVVTESLAA